MGFLGALKTAFKSGAREINKEYGKTNDFLNACCASCALVAYADGTCEDAERAKAIQVIKGHAQLSALYQGDVIESAMDAALKHAKDASGRQFLAREIDAVKSMPSGSQMAEDVYLVALDVASSNHNGKPGDDETAVLQKIAKRLSIDESKFEF